MRMRGCPAIEQLTCVENFARNLPGFNSVVRAKPRDFNDLISRFKVLHGELWNLARIGVFLSSGREILARTAGKRASENSLSRASKGFCEYRASLMMILLSQIKEMHERLRNESRRLENATALNARDNMSKVESTNAELRQTGSNMVSAASMGICPHVHINAACDLQ